MSSSHTSSHTSSHLTNLSSQTKVVAAGRPERKQDGPVNPPIDLNATYAAPGIIGYGRHGNGTWTALETAIELLEGGKTLVYASGLAAISAYFSLIPRGSIITTAKNGYTGTMALLNKLSEAGTATIRFVDISNTAEVLAALNGSSHLWIESPTNPALEVADMPTIITAAKAANIIVAVDNTFATPLLQQPIMMGADVVVHSLTKYIAGHSDVLLGSVSTKDEATFTKLAEHRRLAGAIPGPFEVWLALRGLRTLSVRMDRAQSNALELATRLSKHPLIDKVRYPGLPSDPHHATAKKFMKGFGAIVAFEIKGSPEQADKVTASSELVTFATSLGGVESLWERRHRWSSESASIPKNLIRLSVGIEGVEDLWADIDQALKRGMVPTYILNRRGGGGGRVI